MGCGVSNKISKIFDHKSELTKSIFFVDCKAILGTILENQLKPGKKIIIEIEFESLNFAKSNLKIKNFSFSLFW